MAGKNDITVGVGFQVDKSGLSEVQKSLDAIRNLTNKDMMKMNNSDLKTAMSDLNKIRSEAAKVEDALEKAFNTKLGTVNLQSFNRELSKSNTSLQQVYSEFSKAGAVGEGAFRSLANTITTSNKQLKQSHEFLNNIAETLGRTIKWNLASTAINSVTGSIQQAIGFAKSLDNSLNDIQIVTGKSADEMDRFATKANKAAQSLGIATTDYTDASLTFYQQGLSDREVEARTDLTTKVANVSGLNADDAAEFVTSVLNGYKVGAEEAEQAMDKLAAVGATTASSLRELSEGMAKVASSANTMGVSEDQLVATLSTVIAATRQDASSVGTAFKTIYARISDIEAGTADAEVSLGNYTKAMADMGFNVLDSTGHLRDLGGVIEEIGGNWRSLTREQQVSLAQTMAGTRQYNNLIALFDNWDEYLKAVNTSMQANGTLQQQQNTYMESTAAHMNQLKAAQEKLYDSILDGKTISGVADAMTGLTNLTSNWVQSLGGGAGVLTKLGSVGMMVFSQQIGQGINTAINNMQIAKQNANEMATALENIKVLKEISASGGNENGYTQQLLNMKEAFTSLQGILSPSAFQAINEEFRKFTDSANMVDILEEDKKQLEKFLETYEQFKDVDLKKAVSDETGEKQAQMTATLNEEIEKYEILSEKIQEVSKQRAVA